MKTPFPSNLAFAALVFPISLAAQMSVQIDPPTQPPQPLGTPVTWAAAVSGADSGPLAYRFRIRRIGGDYRTIVDYGPKPVFTWTTLEKEGMYEIEVSVVNRDTREKATTTGMFTLTTLVTGDSPVVTPTVNPLVFIYSAPPCEAGGRMRVEFEMAAGGGMQSTPYESCTPGSSMNFYLAGMYADTAYVAHHVLDTGSAFVNGPAMSFASTDAGMQPPGAAALTTGDPPATQGILLQSLFAGPSVATDLTGNIIWYTPADISYLTRPSGGGKFLAIGEYGTEDQSQQFVREFDLAGITQAETNAAQINQQLPSFGVQPINSFHHEARKLPDGSYLVMANSERILTNVQGPGPVDVIGDTILVLDSNLQVTWAWDAFDHLDPFRMAILGESCAYPAGLACAPFYLSSKANDWLHGNALDLAPDGNILYSARHQDWLIKIDYENGAGTGDILWRLGNAGDFQINSSDPNPWFSHQHDAHFEPSGTVIDLFDNGNSRLLVEPNPLSRGQVLQIDEAKRTATLLLNANMGVLSVAVGSAQRLPSGNYHFDAGFIPDANGDGINTAQSVEVNSSGAIVFGIHFNTSEYRSFRMKDLYTAVP